MKELQRYPNHESQSERRTKSLPPRTEAQRIEALRIEVRKYPQIQRAVKAYYMFKEKGCDMESIRDYVGSVAEYDDGNLGYLVMFGKPTGQEIARKLRALDRQIRRLAKRAAEIRDISQFWTHMVEAGAYSVPEELETIAGKLSRVSTEGFGDWFPQRENIIDLLELIERATGRPHYNEVCDLLNAELIWRASLERWEIPEPQFDPDTLKMMFNRYKKREAARIRKRSEVNNEVHEVNV